MCSQFIAMSLQDQLHFVWEKRLCFSCLDGKHTASECKRPSAGYVRGCSAKRCKLLHQSFQGAKKNSGESQSKPDVGSQKGPVEGSCYACSHPQCEGNKVALAIVSMKVRAKGQVKYHSTLALLRCGKHQDPLFYSTT